MNRRRNNKRNLLVGILICFILLILGLTVYYILSNGRIKGSVSSKVSTDASLESDGIADDETQEAVISYQGKKYTYNKKLKNFLFMGIDKQGEVMLKDTPGTAGQADSIMLFSADQDAKTFSVLQISRDSMINVDIYDVSGEYYTSVNAQINTQYAYGNGEKRSCWLMEKKVSELLYELPIQGYFSMNISGIAAMNDLAGGVEITVPEDYTDIDPAFQKGAQITLTGTQAEKYVRSRDTDVSGSNGPRMERQMQYIDAFIRQIKAQYAGKEKYADKILELVEPFVVTDITAEELQELLGYTYSEEENKTVPGEIVQGDVYDEFHVDDEKLYDLLLEKFYIEVE